MDCYTKRHNDRGFKENKLSYGFNLRHYKADLSNCRRIKNRHLSYLRATARIAGILHYLRTALEVAISSMRAQRTQQSSDIAVRASPVRDRIFCKQARAKGQLISLALSCFPLCVPLRSRVVDRWPRRGIPRDFEQVPFQMVMNFRSLLFSLSLSLSFLPFPIRKPAKVFVLLQRILTLVRIRTARN